MTHSTLSFFLSLAANLQCFDAKTKLKNQSQLR